MRPERLPQMPFDIFGEDKNDVIVASLIENPFFGSATLFVQLLPAEYGEQKSRDERRAELEQYLFDGQVHFQRQLQGCFGAFKPRSKACLHRRLRPCSGNAMKNVLRESPGSDS